VFPLYHVLADLAGSRGEQLRAAESSEPLAVEAIALDGRVLLASLQPRPVRCRITGAKGGRASIRRLDEDSFDLATTDPAAFHSRTESAGLELELPPYSYVRLDLE
jgi:hypothetical protein